MLKNTMALNFDRNMNKRCHQWAVFLFCIFLVACSSSKPAPINDRSSGRVSTDQSKSSAKIAPVVVNNTTVKSDPIKDNKNTTTKVEQKQVNKSDPKPEAKSESKTDTKADAKAESKPDSKVDSTVPDADFTVARPATGQTVVPYNGGTNKGIDIAGKMGDPIYAGADGKVIFADSFKGYGNTLIVKHNNRFVTVYSHNKTLLVKEGQQIKRGQKIAEMGDSEADRVKLHFEVRRDGKPVDPSGYLQ